MVSEDLEEETFSLIDGLSEIEDPRINRHKLHGLPEILFISICAMICGAESWRDMEEFGEGRIDFFRRYFELPNGTPSKSTFARVFSLLDTKAFSGFFSEWMSHLSDLCDEVIAIDGKCIRRSYDKSAEQKPLHLVSAFAAQSRLLLGQAAVAEKSNEITAIPELLKLLSVKGAVVTLDAMGCQKSIAKELITREADYVLALKGNHGHLLEEVKTYLESESGKARSESHCDYDEQVDVGHGRVEIRRVWSSDNLEWLPEKSEWLGLRSLCKVESERHIGDSISKETRYFLSSLPANAARHATVIRSHWAIENCLHWILDVTFQEDNSRIRDKNARENIALLRRMALNQLQQAKPNYKKSMSIKGLRKKAGWEPNVLAQILFGKF